MEAFDGSLKLKEITIKGFRGYGRKEVAFDLSSPVTLLVGNNRSGKSSTLNAIEWAIYGNKIAKKEYIEERNRWLIRNRNCDSCQVELALQSESGKITVFRELGTERKRRTENFYLVNQEGKRVDQEETLWSALGMEPKDFASSAYLHQEVIRDILTVDPRIRKSALDRLLGVSELRNLHEAFDKIKAKDFEKRVDKIYQELEERIALRAERYREEMEEAISEGKNLGLTKDDYSESVFKDRCASTLERLGSLAQRSRIGEINISSPRDLSGFQDFSDQVKKALVKVRSENPQIKSQKHLIERKTELDAALGEYFSALKEIDKLRKSREELEKRGNLEKLRSRHQELSRREAELKKEMEMKNSRINVINETIAYLERLKGDENLQEKMACPSCEQDIVPAQILQLLYRRKEETREALGNLDDERAEVEAEKRELQKIMAKLEKLESNLLPQAEENRDERVREIGQLLGREIKKDEDPEKLVRDHVEEIDRKLERIKNTLERYNRDIYEVEESLKYVHIIVRYLTAKKKSKKVEGIKKSQEWNETNRHRDLLYAELDHLDKVMEAVGEALREISEERLSQAREGIIEIYRDLLERPDFDAIEIDPRDYDVYAVKGSERERLISLFNQGDMNCAALAIFLALAGGKTKRGPSFLILDDPTQSLDATQKTRLARVLGKAAESSQILLATMDEEFVEALKREIPKIKKVYRFVDWDPQEGPNVTQE